MVAQTSVTIVAVLACGCSFEPPADVPGPDATTRGPVTATVRALEAGEELVAGAAVLFHDPDGTLVAHETTDASGRAEAELLPGGSVTVVDPVSDPTATLLRTVFAVEPGDDLVFGPIRPQSGELVGTMTVELVGSPGTSHRIVNGCSSYTTAETSSVMQLFDHCAPSTFTVHVVAHDADGLEIAYAAVENVPYVDGGTITVPDNWNDVTPYQLTVEGIPAEMTDAFSILRVRHGDDLVSASARGGAPSGGTFAVNGGYPQIPIGAGEMQVATVGFDSGTESHLIIETRTGLTPTWSFDAATILPRLGGATFDPDTGRIAWTETGGAPDRDVSAVWLTYRSSAGKPHRWTLWGPPDITEVILPELPGELLAGVAALELALIRLYDADTVDGYDAIREVADPQAYDLFQGGTPGTIRWSTTLVPP